MRFKVRDLLLAMALMSVYFAAIRHVISSADHDLFSGQRIRNMVVVLLGIVLGVSYITRRWTLWAAKPIVCEFHAPVPWISITFDLGILLTFVFCARLIDYKIGIFLIAGSTPLLTKLMQSFLYSFVKISPRGIVYQTELVPWEMIVVSRCSDGAIQKLRIGKYWWNPVVEVPSESRATIEKIIADNSAAVEEP